MATLDLSPEEKNWREWQGRFSKTRCYVCDFPAGKFTNKETGEVTRVWFYKSSGDRYVCNRCVSSGKGIKVAKMGKKERKQFKKMLIGGE